MKWLIVLSLASASIAAHLVRPRRPTHRRVNLLIASLGRLSESSRPGVTTTAVFSHHEPVLESY